MGLGRAGRRACGSFVPAGTWHTRHRVGGMEKDRGFVGNRVRHCLTVQLASFRGASQQLGLAQRPSPGRPANTSRAEAHTYSAEEKATSKFWRRFCGLSCP